MDLPRTASSSSKGYGMDGSRRWPFTIKPWIPRSNCCLSTSAVPGLLTPECMPDLYLEASAATGWVESDVFTDTYTVPELVFESAPTDEWTFVFHQENTAEPPDRPMAHGWLEPLEIRKLYRGQATLSNSAVLSIEVFVGDVP